MSEPVRRLTALPQLPSTSTHKFPPRHHPSVSVSTIRIPKLWPLYAEPVSLPPLITACPIWVILRSIATPFAAMVLRTSSQSAFRVERDHRVPEPVLAPSSANPVVDSARKAGTQIKQRVMNSSKREAGWLRQRLVTLMETSQTLDTDLDVPIIGLPDAFSLQPHAGPDKYSPTQRPQWKL